MEKLFFKNIKNDFYIFIGQNQYILTKNELLHVLAEILVFNDEVSYNLKHNISTITKTISTISHTFKLEHNSNDFFINNLLITNIEFNKLINTIKEYYNNDILKNFPYKLESFDYRYLANMLSFDLPNLVGMEIENVKLKELLMFSNKMKSGINIKDSKIYQEILSKTYSPLNHKLNYLNQSNQDRFENLYSSLDENEYGSNEQFIIVYNDEYLIRDGQHRAAYLMAKYGPDHEISILRLNFRLNYYSFDLYKFARSHSILSNTLNTRPVIVNRKPINVFRSDNLDNCSLSELNKLKDLNILDIIDLRNISNKYPNKMLYDSPFIFHNACMRNSKQEYEIYRSEKERSIVDYYLFLVKKHDNIKSIFNILLNAKSHCLFYCKVGRDRTGVVAMLIGLLCGSSFEEIAHEYALTDECYEVCCRNKSTQKYFSYKDSYKTALGFIDNFFKLYETIDNYFESIGFNKEEIRQLRKKY